MNSQTVSARRRNAGLMVAALFACVAYSAAAFAQGQGSVCLVPAAFDEFSKGGATVQGYEAQLKNPGPFDAESVRYVRVDKLSIAKVTSLKPGRVDGIAVAGRHSVQVSKHPDMSEPLATFRFSFEERKTDRLCLWYETSYGSWRLEKDKFCRCR